MSLRKGLIIVAILAAAVPRAYGEPLPQIPVADFFRNPLSAKPAGASPAIANRRGGLSLARYASNLASLQSHGGHPAVQVSPDGQFLSLIRATPEFPAARNLVVIEIGEWDNARTVTNIETGEVRWHTWSRDGRILYRVDRGYEEPDRASLAYLALFTVRHDGSGRQAVGVPFHRLTLGSGTLNGLGNTLVPGGLPNNYSFGGSYSYLDDVPQDPDHVLINEYEAHMFPSVRRLNLRSGWLTTVSRGRMNFTEWFADNRGQVRAAVGRGEVRDDLVYALYYRDSEDADWSKVRSFDDASHIQVHAFDADNRHLWVSARVDADRMALYRMDPVSGRFGSPVHADPVYDVGGFDSRLIRGRDGTPMYFRYDTETQTRVFLSEVGKTIQGDIDRALPDTRNDIVSWDDGWDRFVIHAWSDRHPGAFYYYDREKDSLRLIQEPRPWLDASRMSPMEPIEFKARDGVTLRGYLTRPPDHAGGPSPMILRPHSGPFGARDRWHFDPEVQFLASRGYSVLQINYRGSGGYGYAFEAAGYRSVGREMQDDLTDAVDWAARAGIADPDYVGIYGVGYGGYAAMMGLAATPDRFRLGISYAGVSDLDRFERYLGRPWRPSGFRDWAGNRWNRNIGPAKSDSDGLTEISPINLVSSMRAPVLLIQGHYDPIVRIDEQHWPMIRALRSRKIPHETFVRRFEGHGFIKERHNLELYSAMQKFLARHMPTSRNPASLKVAASD